MGGTEGAAWRVGVVPAVLMVVVHAAAAAGCGGLLPGVLMGGRARAGCCFFGEQALLAARDAAGLCASRFRLLSFAGGSARARALGVS